MLIETTRGRWINSDDIVELYTPRGEHGCRAVMREGPAVDFYRTCEDIAALMRPLIPAQPGFEALQLIGSGTDEEPYEVMRSPIIAWRCGDFVDPVTVDRDDVNVVKLPDGQVAVLALAVYPSEVSWFEEAKQEAAAEAERRRLKLVE